MRKYRNATINLNFDDLPVKVNVEHDLPVKVNVEQSIIALYYLNHYLHQWTYVDHIVGRLVDRLVPYHILVETKCAQFTVGHHKKTKNPLASVTIV